jgi:glyoxylase-like metal-dependent hydrolase (beta-lactamase superfamily II)
MWRMKRVFACLLTALLAAANLPASAQSSTPYRLDKITDGVYLAVPRAPGPDAANIPVLVSDRDVMLVGTHLFPAGALARMQQVKTVTDKSVRYIVNTHYHAASTAAGEAFPAGIDVIGHELARKTLLTDAAGKPRPAGSTVAPPTVGMTTRLALYRGEREIRILFVGRGHSDNDLGVLLPRERIICTGDRLGSGLPDISAGTHTEWISPLESLKLQDFETVLPARGAPFKGKQKIDAMQNYLRDLLTQTTELLNKGLSVEDAARRVDLTSHAKDYPEITRPGVDVNAVRRLKTQIEDPPPPF